MTVAALTETRAQISGDGVTDRVDLTFQFVDETDLRLIHTDSGGADTEWVFQQSPGNWSFSGGDYSAGTIHFTASDLAVGERLTVILTSQYDQTLSLDGGEIDPSVLERGMDKAALQIQSIAGEVGRALRVSPSLSGSLPDLEVPDLPDGHTFVREGDELVPALLDSNKIAAGVAAAQTAQVAAETAEGNASSSAASAALSKSAAATSATAASGSATDAGNSATSASGSATAAASSATAAADSASSAGLAKSAAETAESNASIAATEAVNATTAAQTSEVNAGLASSAASGSASSASSSATAAAGSATAAANSATAAGDAQTAAEEAQAAAEAAAAGDAANTSFTAAGNLSSNNVQDALEELDTEKASTVGVAASLAALDWTYLARRAMSSNTVEDFTGIPAEATKIDIIFNEVTITGSNTDGLIQLGDAGGIETTNYAGSSSRKITIASHTVGSAAGVVLSRNNASDGLNGTVSLRKNENGSNQWCASHNLGSIVDADVVIVGFSSKSLSDVLTQLRITTVNGSAAINGGSIDVRWS